MSGWPLRARLGEALRQQGYAFEADGRARMEIARELGLAELTVLRGSLQVTPWLDGARIDGRYQASLTQVCSLTAEPLPVELDERFTLRVLPTGSPNAPASDSEIEIDPDADDPPDVLEDETLDLTGYVFEHLALDLDPFPRKPGAEFTPPQETAEISPFAVLKGLKTKDED